MEINYDNIDERCKDLVRLFNKIGLKTEFSCSGHSYDSNFMIIFSDEVDDLDVREFLRKLEDKRVHMLGSMLKWLRIVGNDLVENWTYSFPNSYTKVLRGQKPEDVDIETLLRVYSGQ